MKTETIIGAQLAIICAVVDGAFYLSITNNALPDDGRLASALAFSQITVTAVWLVFGKTAVLVRLATFLATTASWLYLDFIPSFYLCFSATTVVICGLSRAIGVKIENPQQLSAASRPKGQFSLAQLLTTVTTIGVLLGIGLALWPRFRDDELYPPSFIPVLEYLLAVVVGALGVWGIFSTAPWPLRLIVLCVAPPVAANIYARIWYPSAWDVAMIFWWEMLSICLMGAPFRLLGYRLASRKRNSGEPGRATVAGELD